MNHNTKNRKQNIRNSIKHSKSFLNIYNNKVNRRRIRDSSNPGIQCGITYKRISCLCKRVGAKKGKILNIYLELENAINKFAVAVEKEERFDHLSIKVGIKGWYSCQGAKKTFELAKCSK